MKFTYVLAYLRNVRFTHLITRPFVRTAVLSFADIFSFSNANLRDALMQTGEIVIDICRIGAIVS